MEPTNIRSGMTVFLPPNKTNPNWTRKEFFSINAAKKANGPNARKLMEGEVAPTDKLDEPQS